MSSGNNRKKSRLFTARPDMMLVDERVTTIMLPKIDRRNPYVERGLNSFRDHDADAERELQSFRDERLEDAQSLRVFLGSSTIASIKEKNLLFEEAGQVVDLSRTAEEEAILLGSSDGDVLSTTQQNGVLSPAREFEHPSLSSSTNVADTVTESESDAQNTFLASLHSHEAKARRVGSLDAPKNELETVDEETYGPGAELQFSIDPFGGHFIDEGSAQQASPQIPAATETWEDSAPFLSDDNVEASSNDELSLAAGNNLAAPINDPDSAMGGAFGDLEGISLKSLASEDDPVQPAYAAQESNAGLSLKLELNLGGASASTEGPVDLSASDFSARDFDDFADLDEFSEFSDNNSESASVGISLKLTEPDDPKQVAKLGLQPFRETDAVPLAIPIQPDQDYDSAAETGQFITDDESFVQDVDWPDGWEDSWDGVLNELDEIGFDTSELMEPTESLSRGSTARTLLSEEEHSQSIEDFPELSSETGDSYASLSVNFNEKSELEPTIVERSVEHLMEAHFSSSPSELDSVAGTDFSDGQSFPEDGTSPEDWFGDKPQAAVLEQGVDREAKMINMVFVVGCAVIVVVLYLFFRS